MFYNKNVLQTKADSRPSIKKIYTKKYISCKRKLFPE